MGWFTSEVLNHLLMYETFKVVRIRDKKLGIARILITCAIFAYVIGYELIHQKGYLLKEAPHGGVTTSLRRGTQTEHLNEYCRNGSIPTQDKLPCLWMDEVGTLNPPGEEFSMFIATRISILTQQYEDGCIEPLYAESDGRKIILNAKTGEECAEPVVYSRLNKKRSRSYYVGDIEYFTMMWSHAVYGSGLGVVDHSTSLHSGVLSMPHQSDINFVPRHPTSNLGDFIAEFGYFGHRSGDILTVETFLKSAGIGEGLDAYKDGSEHEQCHLRTTTSDCDTPCFWAGPICSHGTTEAICNSGIENNRCMWNNDTTTCDPTPPAVEDTYCLPATLRYDGGVFIVMINYETPGMKTSRLQYEYEVQHIPKAEFKTVTAIRNGATEATFYNRHGLRIIFVQKGFLTQFSFKAVLLTLVTGIALFSVAKVVVELVVMKLLPDRKVYENYKYMVTKNFAEIDTTEDHLGGLDAEDFAYGIFRPGVEDIESSACDCTGPQILFEASAKRGTQWMQRAKSPEYIHSPQASAMSFPEPTTDDEQSNNNEPVKE